MKNLLLIGLVLVFLFGSGSTYGQSMDETFRFGQISVRDGLSHSNVFGVIQDHNGFMWFSTQSGLNRYDGYSIKVFESDANNPNSLPTNSVGRMLVDKNGGLWVGTWGEGLCRYDSESGLFTAYKYNQQDPRSFSGTRVLGTHQTSRGDLWFGTYNNGLNRYNPDDDNFIRIRHGSEPAIGLPHDRVWAIHEDGEHHLWVGTEKGLCRLDTRTQQFEPIPLPDVIYAKGSSIPVKAIDTAPDGRVWLGTFVGLFSFYPASPEDVTFHPFDGFTTEDTTTDVRYVYVDTRGAVWVGTMGDGLFYLAPGAEVWLQQKHKSNERYSLPNNFVESIYEDRSQVLWITTFAGIAKYDLKRPKFERFIHKAGVADSLNRNEISCVFEDERGRLWIGTFGGGLSRVTDLKNIAIKPYTPRAYPGLKDDVIRAIENAEDGKIWVGTYRGGLHRFDPDNESFEVFQYDRKNPNSISADQVRALFKDDKNILWIGTVKGINTFDGNQFVNGFNNAFFGRHLLNVIVNAIVEDDQGNKWIGCESGLINYKVGEREVVDFYHDPQDASSLSHSNVQNLFYDSKGRLWVGTYSGLNLYLPESDSFKTYFLKDGLPGNMVVAILEDANGMLWLGTNAGLGRLDPETDVIRAYDIYDGLLDNGFNRGTECITRDGNVYIGGTKGLNRFDPLRIQDNPFVPRVAITGMSRFNEAIDFQVPIYHQDLVTLDYSDKVFSIEFAALDFTIPEKNRYLYKLEGFDSDWVQAGTRHQVTYTNLNSGHYTFKVKGTNNDGVWNEAPTSLKIHVKPPIWATWWAMSIYAVLFCSIVFGLPFLRIRQLNNRRRELSLLVKQRTVELDNKAKRLEDLNNQLLHLDQTVRVINNEVDSGRLWRQLLEQGIDLLPTAQKGVILFLSKVSHCYEVVSEVGHDFNQLSQLQFSKSELNQYFCECLEAYEGVSIVQQPQPFQMGDLPKAQSLIVMCLHMKPQLEGFVLFENYEDSNAFKDEDRKKIQRFKEHALTAVSKTNLIEEVTKTADHLKNTQRLLLETAHQAGMAEIASSVLHNVGNTLNSINTSVDVLQRQSESNTWRFYDRIKSRLAPHENQLSDYFQQDPFGKKVPEALWQLTKAFAEETEQMFEEIGHLREHLESLRLEIQSQQAIARSEGLTVEFNLSSLLEEVLQIQEPLLQAQMIKVTRAITPLPLVRGQASKLKNVLIHLINNAVEAMAKLTVRQLHIETSIHEGNVYLKLSDTGSGIDKEDLCQVFRQGYAGDSPGSTFGLHYCAIALKEMSGEILVESDGFGRGCTFTLVLKSANQSEGLFRSA